MTESKNVRKRLLKLPEGADYLRALRRKMSAMIRAGTIPSIRVGSSVRLSQHALDAWLQQQPSCAKEQS